MSAKFQRLTVLGNDVLHIIGHAVGGMGLDFEHQLHIRPRQPREVLEHLSGGPDRRRRGFDYGSS